MNLAEAINRAVLSQPAGSLLVDQVDEPSLLCDIGYFGNGIDRIKMARAVRDALVGKAVYEQGSYGEEPSYIHDVKPTADGGIRVYVFNVAPAFIAEVVGPDLLNVRNIQIYEYKEIVKYLLEAPHDDEYPHILQCVRNLVDAAESRKGSSSLVDAQL